MRDEWLTIVRTAALTYATGALVQGLTSVADKSAKRKLFDDELEVLSVAGTTVDELHSTLKDQLKKARLDVS